MIDTSLALFFELAPEAAGPARPYFMNTMGLAMRKHLISMFLATLAVSGLTACDPPLPRLELSVATTSLGTDDVPGDGICSSAAAGGSCTLQAAIEEGNRALNGAELTVPSGRYEAFDLRVTGDITINSGTTNEVSFDGAVDATIEDGAKLRLDGLRSPESQPIEFLVNGTLDVRYSELGGIAVVTVNHGGAAVVSNSFVAGFTAISNSGTVVIADSTIAGDPAVATTTSGTTHVIRSAIFGLGPDGPGMCSGDPAFVSHGFVHTSMPCNAISGPGDSTGSLEREVPVAGSPLLDAIPVGEPGCTDPAAVDFYGNPRGVDGDGDGIAGCDIGAVELQPSG